MTSSQNFAHFDDLAPQSGHDGFVPFNAAPQLLPDIVDAALFVQPFLIRNAHASTSVNVY
ncbi:hypothetical protein PACILC2_41510 [Paenibacillus cisolokensis]|uniref:Transposase n=1 Tax=Paenibacillus cisolokensis TaxID=1658519 RepID=A0ABQ4NC76_9BACL|nr:hypothetical protein PACILC2_41510 [Paenibacillus cisolokensis]